MSAAAVVPLMGLLAGLVLMRAPRGTGWRSYPLNWQYAWGVLVALASGYATLLFHLMCDNARRTAGEYCGGLWRWLNAVLATDVALCVMVTVLAVWYTVRLFREW
jgi:hypothetical protein